MDGQGAAWEQCSLAAPAADEAATAAAALPPAVPTAPPAPSTAVEGLVYPAEENDRAQSPPAWPQAGGAQVHDVANGASAGQHLQHAASDGRSDGATAWQQHQHQAYHPAPPPAPTGPELADEQAAQNLWYLCLSSWVACLCIGPAAVIPCIGMAAWFYCYLPEQEQAQRPRQREPAFWSCVTCSLLVGLAVFGLLLTAVAQPGYGGYGYSLRGQLLPRANHIMDLTGPPGPVPRGQFLAATPAQTLASEPLLLGLAPGAATSTEGKSAVDLLASQVQVEEKAEDVALTWAAGDDEEARAAQDRDGGEEEEVAEPAATAKTGARD